MVGAPRCLEIVRTAALGTCALVALACGGGGTTSSGTNGTNPGGPTFDTSFVVSGNPENASGAAWTFTGTVDGVAYDLTGVLYKPHGSGPFPAVVLSHGHDGTAPFYASLIAPTMVSWGVVCIAVNYTHASGVPIGAPGTSADSGASAANIERGHMAYQLLRQLGYVDMTRVAAHGHSMGAFVTAALVGAYPSDFRVASHTAGGVRPSFIANGPGTTATQARTIRTPYELHHGDADSTVSLAFDQRLDSLLTANGVEHVLDVYPGLGHNDVRALPLMLQRVHDWYHAHGLF
jgi:dienelactone hydrolase